MIRLLHRTADGSLVLTKWTHNIPEYAILSHTWASDNEEVTFADLKRGEPQSKPVGFHKIQFCEQQAAKDGFEYFWVDTCCIKKENNTELQEAITSMFKWYRNAAACYVYLADVSVPAIDTNQQLPPHAWELAFRQSRWTLERKDREVNHGA